MKLSTKNITDPIIINEDEVDLSKASYLPALSATEMDEETLTFHVTLDKVTFKKPFEIINTVLIANGYTTNLENILSCLDDFTLGAKVRLAGKSTASSTPAAKGFLPCIQFQLPKKSKVGPILSKFYSEIKAYEAEISKLQGGNLDKKPKNSKTPEQLQKEIDKLTADNQNLKEQVDEISSRLSQAIKYQANANKALASQNILPPNLRIAKVREINTHDRVIVLKTGRTSVNLPMAIAYNLPEPGDQCLVHIENGHVLGAFFYESKVRPFDMDLADVLFTSDEYCKVRNSKRRTFVLKIKNDTESQQFQKLRRGNKVLLYSVNSEIIRLEPVKTIATDAFINSVYESIAVHHISQSSEEKMLKGISSDDDSAE